MKDIRRDTITGGLVIYSSSRKHRPHDKDKEKKIKEEKEDSLFKGIYDKDCPFCMGNEGQNNEKDRIESKGEWHLRSVDNKFPIIDNTQKNLYGVHEVIIESPYHDANYYNMRKCDFKNIIYMYIKRYKDLSKEKGIKYVNIFKNSGSSAGASLDHTHSQIISFNIIPSEVQKELNVAIKHYDNTGENLYDSIIFSEVSYEHRLVYNGKYFLMYIPFASRYSGETRIIPKNDVRFEDWKEEQIEELSYIYDKFFEKWEESQGKIPFNVIVHTNPVNDESLEYYRTHIHIIPRKFNFGGFELSTDLYVCSIDPEDLAYELRFK
ncbi:galactose-1-phosphate uridylyltransferase [Peptostreptococcus equinus]|uniref:DUF4931 domain-containing protein n=1 Tax=Peptostreptococcus equinus TaxID=3003601 RepID=A0ABY7JT55_9FIRM|nr:DUF4931 domain-containing protein [Peptostreptococcus sp. CBA3647]WAW15659.1 DUF4931 domain-containing protein [Peptostreptococcus sp. CBA3647]